MRCLQTFNEALLAKQAWRILIYPNSLMARILKSKYFPNTTFSEAQLSPAISFTWRSIISSRSLLQKGLWKVVGQGHDVHIWEDLWIPSLPNFRPSSAGSVDMEGPHKVSELIHNQGWNETMLHNLFPPWEVEAIMRIPLPHTAMEDKWVWHYTKHGSFTVKSAYYQAM